MSVAQGGNGDAIAASGIVAAGGGGGSFAAAVAATDTANGSDGSSTRSSSEQGSNSRSRSSTLVKPLTAAAPLLSLLTAMGAQMWKEGEEGSEGTGWTVGVKEREAEGEEGAIALERKEKGEVAAGLGGWRYGKGAVLAAMAMQAAQEVLPRVKQALEQMRAGNGGDGDAVWLQALVQHARVCGGWVSADGENAPNKMAVSACDASLHTKWLSCTTREGKYRLSDAAPVTVTMYSITSANDCPERDPWSWSL
ncbi:unnamed protein product [Closterium sp. Naga37s-1]|nr:unnamed protein product [Closterium sp. Naga37s-1]